MNKLVIVSVLIALLALGADSFRVPREIEEEEEEEKGPVTMIMDKLKNYYDYSLGVAGSYVDTIKELKLDEKAKNLYEETTGAVRTYAGIFQDQLYHMVYSSDSV
ncbi:apolipoprotein C-II [Hemibagrus wyckioides]|nr:apolipoprotein C-II [Hemibagrus wyckioides]